MKVSNEFGVEYIGNYHDLHLKTVVLLLADVFEKLRNMCLWIRSLSLFQQTQIKLVKTAGVKLDLIIDLDMCQFVGTGMRGRVSYIAQRNSKCNIKYMKSYDKDKHAKKLYGSALSQYLPFDGFKWLTQCQIYIPDLNII